MRIFSQQLLFTFVHIVYGNLTGGTDLYCIIALKTLLSTVDCSVFWEQLYSRDLFLQSNFHRQYEQNSFQLFQLTCWAAVSLFQDLYMPTANDKRQNGKSTICRLPSANHDGETAKYFFTWFGYFTLIWDGQKRFSRQISPFPAFPKILEIA